MKNTFKKIIPQPIWYFARDTYDAVRRIPELPDAYLHPWRRESIKRLGELKDIHKGKRAFIIGTGPSLKKTDLSKLKNEITFGLNRSYVAFSQWGFSTTYLCVTNDLVVQQFVDDINALALPKFIAWRSHRHFSPDMPISKIPNFIYTSYTGPRFATDIRGRVWEGEQLLIWRFKLHIIWGLKKPS